MRWPVWGHANHLYKLDFAVLIWTCWLWVLSNHVAESHKLLSQIFLSNVTLWVWTSCKMLLLVPFIYLILLCMSLTSFFDVNFGFSHQFMAATEHSLGNMILKIILRNCQTREVWLSRQQWVIPKYTVFQKTESWTWDGISLFRTVIFCSSFWNKYLKENISKTNICFCYARSIKWNKNTKCK